MKNFLKNFALLVAVMLSVAISASAQVYDGITQPTKYRVWLPASVSLDNSDAVTISPFVGFKQDMGEAFSVTGVAQYNVNAEAFIPQVWLNYNINKKFYVLSRSIYDTKASEYRHTLSATYKLPYGFMVDSTWENLYNGRSFCETDRLQFLGGYAYKWFVVNAGYSCRTCKGMVANVRLKLTEYDWLQFKYDKGTESVHVGMAIQFT